MRKRPKALSADRWWQRRRVSFWAPKTSALDSSAALIFASYVAFSLTLETPPPRFALQPAFHYGLIPLIIVVGMSIKQDGRRPTLAQLLSPM